MERTTAPLGLHPATATPEAEASILDVLIVEDDAAHAEALRRSLTAGQDPIRVRIADSLAAFRTAHAEGTPDIVLMDINLPDGRAMDTLVTPAEAGEFPVLIMTSQGDESTAVEAMKAGAIDFVVKSPESFGRITRIVDRALREWHLLRERAAARNALRERDTLFRLLTENSGEAILLTEPDGRILSANPEACRVFGYSEAELMQIGRSGLLDPADPRLAAAMAERNATGRFKGELSMRRKNGETFEAGLSSTLFEDGNGQQRSSLILRDLTVQKDAERTLRASEGWLRHIVENLPAGAVLVHDGLVVLNREAERIVGYADAEIGTLERWFRLLYAECADEVRAQYDSDRIEGFALARTRQLRRKDGALRWVSFSSVTSTRAEFWVLQDRTDEMLAESALRESEQRFRIAANAAPAMIWMSGKDGEFTFVNQGWIDFTGRAMHDELGHGWENSLHEADAERARATYREALAAQTPYTMRFRMRRHDGSYRWVEDRGVPRRDSDGRMIGYIGVTMDVNEAQHTEEELRIAAAAFETREAMFVAGFDGRLLRANSAFAAITGLDAASLPGSGLEILAADRFDAGFYRALWRSVVDKGYWHGEILCRRADGEIFPASLIVSAVASLAGDVTHIVGSLHDVSERRAAEEEIRRLAFYDPLTRLPNRRLLQDRMQHAFAASARHGHYGAVYFIDLDHFKTLNDTRGHSVGDTLLLEMARRLTECVRRTDTVARLGGDEFVVIAEELGGDLHAASSLAEGIAAKMLTALSMPCPLPPGDPHEGSCSIGVALFRGFEASVDDNLRRADAAMYRAKAGGRNGVRFFDPTMQEALEQRAALEADLRHAGARDQLRLHYQVQMNAIGQAIGAEALVRWDHPARGLIAPAQFIPLAEETGLILHIGHWVLEAACAQLARWADDPVLGLLRLSINVSARQFRQLDFVDRVQEVLRTTGADPTRLKLELTEGSLLDDVDLAISRMGALRAVGVGFSLDDFGTGYSSLSYLKRLPIEQLKIDRSFIRDLAVDADDAMIVQAIIGMARNLRLDVIAEGVEDERQLEFLRVNGCFAFQGFLFSQPLVLEEFETLVRALVGREHPQHLDQMSMH
ncbi:MAG: EAL domain-containing protein [Betaproteobacteria bacterium]